MSPRSAGNIEAVRAMAQADAGVTPAALAQIIEFLNR
jgi:hypothetical protein